MKEQEEKTDMERFREILKSNQETLQWFAKEIGTTYGSFRAMTVSTRPTPKWVKAFLLGYDMRK